MKRGLFLALLCAAHAHAGETETVFNSVRDSVVTLTVYDERKQIDGAGSGVVLGPGRVITNCHVVREAVAIQVRAGDKEWSATVALTDSARDLCQLDVPGLTAPAAKIRSYREVQIGEPIYAVGNPLGFGLAVSAGLISSIAQHKGELRLFSSAPISPGSSGGGLFDSKGRLIGVTTGFYPGAQNLNLAVPADWIAELPARGVPRAAAPASTPDPDWPGQSETHRIAGEWAKLAAWSRRWREAYPTSAEAGSYLGLALANLNQLSEAKDVLLIALRQDPNHATAHIFLAQALYRLGEKEAAMAVLKQAIALAPAGGYFYYTRALWQRDSEDIQGALESVQTALKFDSGNEFTWQLLGDLRHKQQRFAEAAQAYRTVLRLKPNHPMATANLASALAAMGETNVARQVLTAAPPGLPSDATTWLQVGYAEEKLGHFAEAERAYRKALEINPALADAWNSLGHYLIRMSRNAEAEEALRQAVKYRPNFAPSWIALGDVVSQRGDKAGAKEAYEKATMADPKNAGGWFGLGLARRELGDYANAVTAMEKAVRLVPPKSAGWALLGEMQFRTGQRDAAFKSFQEAEKLESKNEAALSGLSMYYGMSGDPGKSLDYALRALAVNSASAHHWNSKGYALLKLQRYAEAIPALETATRLQPDLTAAWVNLGEAYLRAKQLGKAISTLEQALKLAPKAADAQFFLSQAYAGSGQNDKAKDQLSLLVRQTPNFAPAWGLMTVVNLSQGNQPDALAAYTKLKLINPTMARQLSLAFRKQNPMSTLQLPD